jgi:hypothetical protein
MIPTVEQFDPKLYIPATSSQQKRKKQAYGGNIKG